MKTFLLALTAWFLLIGTPARADETLNILTWEGYVTPEDVSTVNALLQKEGYAIEVKVISPYAQGAEQMFTLMRGGKVDISFLTLFFIKMQGEKASKIIQPIQTESPRLGNYKHLLPELTQIPMGMRGNEILYLPFAGGSYGFYANHKTVSAADIPQSWSDLFAPRWKGKYSLNKSQVWYNVAIASIALGYKPYYLNDMANARYRLRVIEETRTGSPLAEKLQALYAGAGDFWDTAPTFAPHLDMVSSWGTEVAQANRDGGDWRKITFKEGDLVWMDTINFMAHLRGKKLEAAEIVANYFIGREVQSRVARELSLVAVSKLAATNPIWKNNPHFFTRGAFVPPYNTYVDNLMTHMSNTALSKIKAAP